MFNTVLFPIDQSRESREAADKVLNIVKTYEADLVLLSVVQKPPSGENAPPADSVMSQEEAVEELLNTAQKVFSEQGIKAKTIEREGKPAFEICDVADEIEADLIVMGCRGMGLTEEGSTESVTSLVINLSPCPVLIVP